MKNLSELSIEKLTAKIRESIPSDMEEPQGNMDIAKDILGHWYNAKYPPNFDIYGHQYDGYKTDAQSVFFYTFAVQQYDISFSYQGNTYYIGFFDSKACLCNKPFDDPYLSFPSGNMLLEQFTIDGVPLIKLLEDLEDIDIC